jgi:hypothetical protein
MNTTTRIYAWFERWIVAESKSRLWAELQNLNRDFLAQAGFSPELLKKGPHAWPWRSQTDGCWGGKALTDDDEPHGSLQSPDSRDRDGPIVAPV